MRERLEAMIGRAAEGVWLGTFHAIAARILRRHAEAVGLKPSFTILDTDDQLRLLKQIAAGREHRRAALAARALLLGADSSAGRIAASAPTRFRRPMPAASPTAGRSSSTASTRSA